METALCPKTLRPPLIIHKLTARRNVLIKNLNNTFDFYCNYQQDNWSSLLPLAQFVMNARFSFRSSETPRSISCSAYTPRWQTPLQLSDNPSATRSRISIRYSRNDAIACSKQKPLGIMKSYYDAKRDDLPPFEVGSKVWLESTKHYSFRPMKKLAEKRYGPFEILEIVGPSAYRLRLPTTWKGNSSGFQRNPLNAFRYTPFQPVNDPTPSNRPVYRLTDIRSRVNPRHSKTTKQDVLSC